MSGLFVAMVPCQALAAKYKVIARLGQGNFNYTAPSSSGTTSGQELGAGVDMVLGGASSVGFDVVLGLSFSDKLINFSQVNFLYKFFPFSYSSVVVGGDNQNSVTVRSNFMPYIGGGVGYSTLVIKALVPGTNVLASTNSQFFNLAFALGTDYMFSNRWGLNFQTVASYGQGGTSEGNMSAFGYVAAIGALLAL